MKAILINLIIGMTLGSSSIAGVDQGNGGDIYSAEFVELAQNIYKDLDSLNAGGNTAQHSLKIAIPVVKIESTDQPLFLNGIAKDAINYEDRQVIVFNRDRWESMVLNQKKLLVLHEYLDVSGVDDSSYYFSLKSLRYLENHRYDFGCYLILKPGPADRLSPALPHRGDLGHPRCQ